MDSETGNQLRLALTSNPTFDCNPGCRSKQHASQLISSITKGTNLQIRLFLSRCHNAESVVDEFGRNTLHVAASCGQDNVVEWLIAEQGASVAAVDGESRWTALHRAVFYGQLSAARLLIAYGSSLQQRDKEGLTPLDIIMKDRLPHVEFLHTGLDELFTWGANSTFTLGHENMQPRKLPEQVESFRRHAISIKRVVMSKYHSTFLSDSGQVYTCGHGLGGRLGQGDEQTYLVPKLIDALKKEVCVDIAAAVNHTVMLMENGTAYSCGLNSYHQLGQFPPPEKVLAPKPVNGKSLKGRHIIGVCAQRFHTVLYTVDTVFTCGLNAGQLGHYKVGGESLVSQPRPVAALCHKDTHIQQVAASDAATVIVTSKGDVYALHEYQCRKIVSKWLDIAEVHCSGGHLDHNTDAKSLNEHGGAPLTVVLLTTTGKVFVCHASSDCVARRCVWMMGRPLFATHLALGANVLAVVTKDGEAFTGIIPQYMQPLSNTTKVVTPGKDGQHFDTFSLTLSELVLKDDVIEVSLNRVPLVHRATAVSTDQQGANISVLQSHPKASITCLPSVRQSEMKFHMAGLLSDAHQDDCVHDVILQVGSERLPLHRYILAQRSEYFRRQFAPTLDEGCSRTEDVSSADHPAPMTVLKIDLRGRPIFLLRQLLQFIYTDSCDFVSLGFCIQTYESPALGSVKDSAPGFEVTAGGRKGKKSKKKCKETNCHPKDVSADEGKNAKMIEMLKELAKEFGVAALVKKLDAVQLVDGYVVNAPGQRIPSSSLRFERKSSIELSDVCIEGGDGATIECHKCILVARLEYFRSMFSSSWIEMTNSTTLRLPFPVDVLRIVIKYLYTDCCTVFEGPCDTELLCSVLVAADQLLIGRLRDECEAALAQQLNLRNVCELLEFATVYNASQLVVTCQQFITINLAALLETRSLDLLSGDVIEKLTEYYKEKVIGMNRRRITPYSSWPDFELLEFLEKSVMEPTSLRSGGTVATPSIGKKTGMPRRRTRTKSTEGSVESAKPPQKQVSTEDLVSKERDLMDAAIEEEAIAEVDSTIILPLLDVAPLPAVHVQSSTVRKSLVVSEPTAVTAKSLSAESPQMGSVPEKHCSLRDIIYEEMAKTIHSTHITTDQQASASSSRWPKKLSQKERKRLGQVAEKFDDIISVQTGDQSGNVSTSSAEMSAASASPWKAVDNVVHSFKDLMLTEKTALQKASIIQMPYSNSRPIATKQNTTSTNSDSSRLSWGILPVSSCPSTLQLTPVTPSSEPASPTESPWHLPTKVSDARKSSLASGGGLSSARFSDIVQDEMTQVQTLRRTTNKSLSLIQIEEQAMSELLHFYKASDNVHQYITVERVPSANAQPLWAATQRQSSRLV